MGGIMRDAISKLVLVLIIPSLLCPRVVQAEKSDSGRSSYSIPSAASPAGHQGPSGSAKDGDPSKIELLSRWAEGPSFGAAFENNVMVYGNGGLLHSANLNASGEVQAQGVIMLPGFVRGVDTNGSIACSANWLDGLRIIDVSDPANPMEVGQYMPWGNCLDVVLEDQYAYVIESGTTIDVLDLSDPSDPVLVAYMHSSASNFTAISISGDYAVATHDTYGIFVFDVSDPTDPVQVGHYDENVGVPTSVDIKNDFAYIADGVGGLMVLYVGIPENPVFIDYYFDYSASDVSIDGDLACVVGEGVHVLDVSNPGLPVEIGLIEDVDWSHDSDIKVRGSMAFLTTGDPGGVYVIDLSDPSAPEVVEFHPTGGVKDDVWAHGDFLYSTNRADWISVLDISDPQNPSDAGRIQSDNTVKSIALEGDFLYAIGDSQLSIFDVADPGNPVPRSSIGGLHLASDLDVDNGIVCIIHSSGLEYRWDDILQVVDVADPDAPSLQGSIYGGSARFNDVAVLGGMALLAGDTRDVFLFDVSDPADPIWRGRWDNPYTSSPGYAVALRDSLAYVASYGDFRVLDVSDPANPIEVGGMHLYYPVGGLYDLALCGDYAYLAAGGLGALVFDVSDPTDSIEIDGFDTGNFGWGVECMGLNFAIADASDGIYLLQNNTMSAIPHLVKSNPGMIEVYPNPFNPRTTIAFENEAEQVVSLKVFDISGRLVRVLIQGEVLRPGRHETSWDGRDEEGQRVASGTYFCRYEAGGVQNTKRMMLVK